MRFSKTAIDETLWQIEGYLMSKYGSDTAQREMYPLLYHINTGRATTDFLKKLCASKPFMVGRILHEGGTYSEVIGRIKTYMERS